MRGAASVARSARALVKPHYQVRYATSHMRMPAMSPTMTEGGIAGWKKAEGEAFTTGDVLLEIETDKATIDVEAQDDGMMGKILAEAGSSKIPVGQIIAILAEEGDDLSNLETPANLAPEGESSGSGGSSQSAKKEEETPAPAPAPAQAKNAEPEQSPKSHGHKVIKHSKPLFPSVSRLLAASDLSSEQIESLKGTGKNGMLTKGDVLKALGKISSAWGTAEKLSTDKLGASGRRASESKITTPTSKVEKKEAPLDALALRRLVVQGMGRASAPSKPIVPHTPPTLPLSSDHEFDSVIADYASLLPPSQPKVSLPDISLLAEMESQGAAPVASLSRPKKDDFAGLY